MMKWKKLGLVFCPDNNYDWMVSHAAVPYAYHLTENLYKIYFSSRDKHNRSYVNYIVIDISNPYSILELSKKPLLDLGDIGCFDDSGTMLTWITKCNGMDYLYYIGWNLGVTVPFRNSLGLATSQESQGQFKKFATGPVLDRNLFEPHFVASACVLAEENIWKIWYLSCVKWKLFNNKTKHYYHIKYAESKDGINWQRNGIVAIDFKSPDEHAISRPSVLKENNIYKMWYSYRGEHYRIGYAESQDGINWQRKDEDVGITVSTHGWDSESIEYPHVFIHNGQHYMLYNGNGYGKTGFGLAVLE